MALIRHWRLSQRGRTYERSAAFLVAKLVQRLCEATINSCRWMKELVQAVNRSPNIGQPLLDSGFCRLVLQDVPVFGKTAVLDPDNIRCDSRHRPASS